MAGKYAAVIGRLPKFQGDEPYDVRVRERKVKILEELRANEARPSVEDVEPKVRELMGEIVDRIVKVNNLLLNCAPVGTSAIARLWKEMRGVEEILDEEHLAELRLNMEATKEILVEAFDAEQLDTLKLANGVAVQIQPEPYAKVKDRDAFREWCLKNDLGNSLQLHWSTTNALVKERLLQGLPEPDGVEATSKPKVILRAPKGF